MIIRQRDRGIRGLKYTAKGNVAGRLTHGCNTCAYSERSETAKGGSVNQVKTQEKNKKKYHFKKEKENQKWQHK